MEPQEEDDLDCPLCMEKLDEMDRNFKPCVCGYQICQFCWHHIRKELNGLCPACRREYADTPIEFSMPTMEDRRKARQKAAEKKKKEEPDLTSRQRLTNVRVVQKNLVYVIGIPLKLAHEDLLRSNAYFGQYGKVAKIVVNRRPVNTNGTPTVSAYVTFVSPKAADACIRAVDGITLDNCLFRASFGTTKYCNQFLRGATCHNPECMYLHDDGDKDMSFSKEEMAHGKHGLSFGPPLVHDVHVYSDAKGNVLPPPPVGSVPLHDMESAERKAAHTAATAAAAAASASASAAAAAAAARTASWKPVPPPDSKPVSTSVASNPADWPVAQPAAPRDNSITKAKEPAPRKENVEAHPWGKASAAAVVKQQPQQQQPPQQQQQPQPQPQPQQQAPPPQPAPASPAPPVATAVAAAAAAAGSPPERLNAKARRELRRAMRQAAEEQAQQSSGSQESSPGQDALNDADLVPVQREDATPADAKPSESEAQLLPPFQLFGGESASPLLEGSDVVPMPLHRQTQPQPWQAPGVRPRPASIWESTSWSSVTSSVPLSSSAAASDPLSVLRSSTLQPFASPSPAYGMSAPTPSAPYGYAAGPAPAASSIWSSAPSRPVVPPASVSTWAAVEQPPSLAWDATRNAYGLAGAATAGSFRPAAPTADLGGVRPPPPPPGVAGHVRPRPTLQQLGARPAGLFGAGSAGSAFAPQPAAPSSLSPGAAELFGAMSALLPPSSSTWAYGGAATAPSGRVPAPPPGFRGLFTESPSAADPAAPPPLDSSLASLLNDIVGDTTDPLAHSSATSGGVPPLAGPRGASMRPARPLPPPPPGLRASDGWPGHVTAAARHEAQLLAASMTATDPSLDKEYLTDLLTALNMNVAALDADRRVDSRVDAATAAAPAPVSQLSTAVMVDEPPNAAQESQTAEESKKAANGVADKSKDKKAHEESQQAAESRASYTDEPKRANAKEQKEDSKSSGKSKKEAAAASKATEAAAAAKQAPAVESKPSTSSKSKKNAKGAKEGQPTPAASATAPTTSQATASPFTSSWSKISDSLGLGDAVGGYTSAQVAQLEREYEQTLREVREIESELLAVMRKNQGATTLTS